MAVHVREGGRGELGAPLIRAAFLEYELTFWRLTLQARQRFESQAWSEAQRDSAARIGLYRSSVQQTVRRLEAQLGERLHDASLWRQFKQRYADALHGRASIELAETFFNSVVRKIFRDVGVDHDILFDNPMALDREAPAAVTEVFQRQGSVQDLVVQILQRMRFAINLIAIEKKKVTRFVPEVPVYDLQAGNEEGQVPLRKLNNRLMKLPRNLKTPQVIEVNRRLKPLGTMNLPIPKGPMPRNARMPRGPRS
jgi:hypothetical protein